MPPLELRLVPRKQRLLFGEGVVLDLEQATSAPLQLESVELNRDRTELVLTRLDGPAPKEERLDGRHHAKLYLIPPADEIGRSFEAPAGARWKAELELLLYRRPLAPGAWRLGLRYRLAAAKDAEVVEAAPVEWKVDPATTLGVTGRWFHTASRRGERAQARVVRDGEELRWHYQVAAGHDAGVLSWSLDVGPAPDADARPVVAHLNKISQMRVERWLVWARPDALGALAINRRGRRGDPKLVPHGLQATPPPVLLDPPLHGGDGRLVALLAGTGPKGPALSLVEVDPQGAATHRLLDPLGPVDRAVVVWTGEAPAEGLLFRCAPGDDGGTRLLRHPLKNGRIDLSVELGWTGETVVALLADQWTGQGGVCLVTSAPGKEPGQVALRTIAWDVGGDEPCAERVRVVQGPLDVVDVQPVEGGRDAVLLGRCAAGWLLVGPQGTAAVPLLPEGEPRPPALVVGEERVQLVRWTPSELVTTSPTWEAP